jgi:hypothetical protein
MNATRFTRGGCAEIRLLPGNANILSEMVQRTHWKDTYSGIGTCQDTGHGADAAVASAGHHQMTVLA